ncbi:MAG TPA: alpha-2-macroglobulin family protein [Thermoguttaceae bacterium]|nr:alpha-2-macroglobulin family protein [Thermoguttaceae bacterium]
MAGNSAPLSVEGAYGSQARGQGRAGKMADFDSLIGLINGSSRPESWSMQRAGDAVVLNGNGVAQNVHVEFLPGTDVLVLRGHQKDVEKVTSLIAGIEQLAGPGAKLLAGLASQETGYWNPSIVTDESGKATVTFAVPERSTAWTLLAKGITTETLAGEATDELVVKKDLFGELKLPLAFTDGDEAQVLASVHNDAIAAGKIDVTLKTTIEGRNVEETKTVDVQGKGIHEVVFQVKLDRPEAAEEKEEKADDGRPEASVAFELTVAGQTGDDAADRLVDVVRRTVPLKPYGMRVFATAGGSATSDATAWVEAPKDMALASPSLEILVGPTMERSLLDVVLAPAPLCQVEMGRIASGLDSTTSDVMASLGLQELLGATREAGTPQAQSLDGRVRSGLSLLVSSQNDDGGWSWTGRGGASDRCSTARAVWAMSLARAAGYTVPDDGYHKAVGHLRDQLSKTEHGDYESQAILLHALSVAGSGDFAVANRLYRNRQAMSNAALVYLSLAFTQMDRKATAEELLGLMAERDLDEVSSRLRGEKGLLPWSHSPAELRALYALAVQEVNATSPVAKEQVDWLLAHRTGHRWSPDKATGPAALALSRWFAQSRFEAEHYELGVFVNDVKVKSLDIDQTATTQVIDVPARFLAEGKQRINFQITGRGRYTYQCILGGFVPADRLKSTTAEWEVRRTFEPAPLEMDGREIPRGFDVVQLAPGESPGAKLFRNPLTELPVGRRGLVELYVRRSNVPSNTPEEQLEYLVITEPIPSGATVIEDSVRGGFERFEISPGAITFYVGSRRQVGSIHYELRGYLPGKYRAGPTQIRNAYRPEQLVVADPKPLGVLPLGAETSDAYRLTPKELHELGKRHFAQGDRETAGKHLTELVENWNLKPAVYKEAVETLLDVHLELGPASKVVHYFEIVKEKWPDKEIPFDQIVRVGAAYHEMGEYERSYLVFRATVESSFRRESGVAGFLDSEGEFSRSVDVMQRLLREYPPEAYLAAATYALAQRVYAKAPEAADDPKLRREKVNRVDLVRRAWSMLESFLTAYPEDPAADQAAFSTANALLELEAYEQATAACNRYAERYPESKLLDSFWYIIGFCHFATGEHAKALEMCGKVAEAKRVDKQTGREEESRNKWQAIYILGQVHHSLGAAADAVREYRRVADRFPDAEQAIDYFLRKAIALDEVTTVKPGEPVELELRFRNVPSCDAKVYRIDLMKFSLMKRNLGEITRINLAGIRPFHETAVRLGDGKDYRDRTHKLPLPLKDEGAYLVVCRGGDLYASGFVLLSPLAVEVQHDPEAGQVRATVKDVVADRYLRDVQVKVMGSAGADVVSGSTDLRGVFVAQGIQGSPTVIAQAGPGRYAFFRSLAGQPAVQYPSTGPPIAAMPQDVKLYQPVDFSAGSTSESESEKRIHAALASPTVFQFVETPLSDVVDQLKRMHGIEIRLDQRALDDVGISTDVPITQQLRGVSLRSALKLMLRELDLTSVVQDEVLLITTPEEAEVMLATVAYPVSDLVRFRDKAGEQWSDFDSLIDTITSTVSPESWDEVGGPGSISPMQYGNTEAIILSQTQEVHEEVTALLERLRTLAATEKGDGKLPLKERLPQSQGRGQGFGFGGGMMGGMGGAPSPAMGAAPSLPQGGGKGELLQGLQDANRQLQTRQVDQLQKMYQGGMGGMGGVPASAAF